MLEIGERIKDVRKSAEMSQKVFAEALGVHQGHISKIETGAALPSNQLTRSICRTFLVNYNWLREGRGRREPKWTEEILEDFKKLGSMSTEEARIFFIFRLLSQRYNEYNNVIKCLGDDICILGDPGIQPGDPVIIKLVKKILRRLEGEEV